MKRSTDSRECFYLVVRERGEEVKAEQGEDSDDQEENDDDVQDRPERLQCVSECSMQTIRISNCLLLGMHCVPPDRIAEMIVDQKDWPQSANHSEIRSPHDQSQYGVEKHHKDARHLYHSPRMGDE